MARRSARGAQRPDPAERFYNEVAEELIRQIEAGTAPWQQGWEDAPARALPVNLATGKEYRGVNVLRLEMTADIRGYRDERWATYKQISEAGGQVRRGQRGVQLIYWKFEDEQRPPRAADAAETDRPGEEPERPRRRGFAYPFRVFNAEQARGLPERPDPEGTRWPALDEAERALRASGARIEHDGGDRAYYDLGRDSIHIPRPTQFPTAANYYNTALHELGHWSGHPDRLNRETLVKGIEQGRSSSFYAREELRAEITSMILARQLNIGHNPARHASYAKFWVELLEDDSREIHRAAREAYQASDYILVLARSRDHELDKALASGSAWPAGAPGAKELAPEPVQGSLFQGARGAGRAANDPDRPPEKPPRDRAA